MDPAPARIKPLLDALVARYEQPAFILDDPVSIPHGFDDPRDQEVIGLYAAVLAWGRRATIMAKMEELCDRMEYRPSAFVRGFDDRSAERLAGFKHRTFQPADAYWFTRALSRLLRDADGIEELFARHLPPGHPDIGPAIEGFSRSLLGADPGIPPRLGKHLARPSRGSACKRLSLYARWMVRPGPVDLGLWTRIRPSQLVLPLDVHAGRQARAFGMLGRRANDWRAVLELTRNCRALHPEDPCRYDYAFFGPGVSGNAAGAPAGTGSEARSGR